MEFLWFIIGAIGALSFACVVFSSIPCNEVDTGNMDELYSYYINIEQRLSYLEDQIKGMEYNMRYISDEYRFIKDYSVPK